MESRILSQQDVIRSQQIPQRILVTGGAGFIGSNLVRSLINEGSSVLVYDKLGYAGHRESLSDLETSPLLQWCVADLCDYDALNAAVIGFEPDAVIHLAAESHVDRSIAAPILFAQSNVVGSVNLLEVLRQYHNRLTGDKLHAFKLIHVSTDEVFGTLNNDGVFNEDSPYSPNSPYAASKAASDHFVRAYRNTYGFPVNITNCSNNYGPYQHPEKLIPVVITRALAGQPIPVYGTGLNVRDWLHVQDHCLALLKVLRSAPIGEDYMIGAKTTLTNLDLIKRLCSLMDHLAPRADGRSYECQIEMVDDRLGHDFRYAVDPSKIMRELQWRSSVELETGLSQTVQWYLANRVWWQRILSQPGSVVS